METKQKQLFWGNKHTGGACCRRCKEKINPSEKYALGKTSVADIITEGAGEEGSTPTGGN